MTRFLTFLTFVSLLAAVPARAEAIHETFYVDGAPSGDQVRYWSTLPGARSYTIAAGDPSAEQLTSLATLRGADRIQVEVQSYPNEDALAAWKKLADQGIELVVMGKVGLPTDDEVRRLNAAGFERCLFVLDYYPDPEEAQRLGRLSCRVSLTFAVSAYPRYEDKPGLSAIPESVPLLFASDYWPWYTHMDTLNLLPHHKRLRVVGMLPPDESLPYLHGIRLLDVVQLSTEFDPQAADWRKFDGLPLTWSSESHVPAPEALEAFARSGAATHSPEVSLRRLIIDSDTPLTAEEHGRLERGQVPVEWIHAAPFAPALEGGLAR